MKQISGTCAYLLMMVLLLAACSPEERLPRRLSPQDRVKELKAELDLTDEQSAAIEKILVDLENKMSELREQSGGDRQAMREEFRQLREETDRAIEAVLFEDQIEKYREYNRQRWENMRQRNRDNRRQD
jgi:hypothetical protein